MDPRRRAVMGSSRLQEWFRSDSPLVRVRRTFPNLAWRAKAWRTPSPQRSAAWLQELDAVGSDVLIVSGEDSFRPIRLGASPRLLTQLDGRGRLRLAYLPELEHGLLIARQRLEVQDLVTEHIRMRFGCKEPEAVTAKEDSALIATGDNSLNSVHPALVRSRHSPTVSSAQASRESQLHGSSVQPSR